MAAIENSNIKDKINTNKEPKEVVIEFSKDTLGEIFIYQSFAVTMVLSMKG